jgi:hypothetical protein
MRRPTTAVWMAAALVVALAIAGIALAVGSPGHKIGMALRATARWSFVLFSLGSFGGALSTLFGARFHALAQHGREFGLAFASAHIVHVALVSVFLYVSVTPFSRPLLVFFAIGVVFTYLLALVSLSAPLRTALGPQGWRILRTLGVEYIAIAFLFDFADRAFQGSLANRVFYLPFFFAAIAGPLLRLAALGKRMRGASGDSHSKLLRG